jgi:hypothetical protein
LPPASSWQFSRAQRQLLWLGVIMSLLATCALAISLPSFNDFELISKASARPVAGSPSTTVPAYKVSLTTTSVAFESKKLDRHD